MKWYELNNEERTNNIYLKFSIKEFYNWWSNQTNNWMEIRTVDWEQAKEIGKTLSIPYSHTGVFINNEVNLGNAIRYINNKKYTAWFGINPRKFNFNKYGSKSLSGGDHFIQSINYIFIDIDRFIKVGNATNLELQNANSVADKILDKLGLQGWNNSYIKICSGNGVQLLIKLDIPINMPNVSFNNENKCYEYNIDFNNIKEQIREGIGQQLIKFINRQDIKDKYGVMIDKAGFKIAQVGALHGTNNYKYNSSVRRGVVELKNGINEGLSDYILNTTIEKKKVFGRGYINTTKVDKISLKDLRQHKLVQLMLQDNLPDGGRNNSLSFSLKCLLKDNKIDLNNKEIIQLFYDIGVKWKDNVPRNPVDNQYHFNPAVVRNWCITNFIPPIYKKGEYIDLMHHNFLLEKTTIETFKNKGIIKEYDIFELNGKDIFEDCFIVKKYLIEGVYNNIMYYQNFILKCIKKYGEKETKYYMEYVIPEELFYSTVKKDFSLVM